MDTNFASNWLSRRATNTQRSWQEVMDYFIAQTGNALKVNNTLYVDPVNGSDATAAVNSPKDAYQTIAAAVTAASSGDLIILLPGDHAVSTNILKDRINFYAHKGVTITSTVAIFNADTTSAGTTLTVPTFFLGHAVLVDNNSGGGGFCDIATNPSAVITAEFDSITSANISNAMVIKDGIFNLLVRGDFTAAGRNFSMRNTGNIYAEIWGTVSCTGTSTSSCIIYSSGHSWSGRAKIKAKTFTLPNAMGNQPYVELIGCDSGKIRIEVDYLSDATAVTFQAFNLGSNTFLGLTFKVNDNILLINRKLFSCSDADNNVYLDITKATFNGATLSAGKVSWLHGGDISSTAAITVSGSGLMYVPTINIAAAPQDLSGPGALSPVIPHTRWTTTGADAGTLADGTYFGQVKIVTMVVDGGDGTLTPNAPVGFATLTFGDVGDEAHLMWIGFGWILIKNVGVAVA